MSRTKKNFVEAIQDWNTTRDNLRYSPSLEYSMLDEELNEYMEAGIAVNEVDQADALGDIIVVAIGSLFKLCEGDKDKFNRIMLAITDANDTKSATKNEVGKITKPDDFVGPEKEIERILRW
jgi:hypothetical protein